MRTQSLITIGIGILMASAGLALGDDQVESGLLVLNSTVSEALSLKGNSIVEVPSQIVYVNSSSPTAVDAVGSAFLDTPALNVVGGASFDGQSECTGTITTGMPGISDPLQGRVFPDPYGMPIFDDIEYWDCHTDAVTIMPGYYPSGLKVSGNAVVTLSPGVYIIGGMGLEVTSGELFGAGVCLVIDEGECKITGASMLTLSPMNSGEMAGIVLAQPASNTEMMHLSGGIEFLISGTIYVPNAELRLVGNCKLEGEGAQMGDLVIADTVDVRGSAIVRIGQVAGTIVSFPTQPVYD